MNFAKIAGVIFFFCVVFPWLAFRRIVKYLLDSYIRKRPSNPYLENNFAPVGDELTNAPLEVTSGALPADLDGFYVRNGPNPHFQPQGNYHWFDGDGMLHGVLFKDGAAAYTNKWVRTHQWKVENELGHEHYIKIPTLMDPFGIVVLVWEAIKTKLNLASLGLRSRIERSGTANTAVKFHARRLMALQEADAPHHVTIPDLTTVGRFNYGGNLKHTFTAHPKICGATGEMLFFGYSFSKKPHLSYSVVSPEGKLTRTLPITLRVPVMMHDFAVTEHYSVFMELPLTFRTRRAFRRQMIDFEPDLGSRFCVLPRHAADESEALWFESDSCYVFHTANAWEEKDSEGRTEVVLVACRSDTVRLEGFSDTDGVSPSQAAAKMEEFVSPLSPFLYEWRFNLETGAVKERRLCDIETEFPVINETLVGQPARYCYSLAVAELVDMASGILKYDMLERKLIGQVGFGPDRRGTEFVFVPRADATAEDDGYLVGYVYDSVENTTFLSVYAADGFPGERDIASPICEVRLPRRVPYGFHGTWVSRDQIDSQLTTLRA